MSAASWRAALRIARRDALRHRARSALTLALVTLPVLGMTSADVLWRTQQLSPAENAVRTMGQADAIATSPENPGIAAITASQDVTGATGRQLTFAQQEQAVRHWLPAGSRIVDARTQQEAVLVRTPSGVTTMGLAGIYYADPLLHGMVRQRSGRAPSGPGEIVISPALAAQAHLHIGDKLVTVHPARAFRVVGTAVSTTDPTLKTAWALPVAVQDQPGVGDAYTAYVAFPKSTDSTALAVALSAHGIMLKTRESVLHPPPQPRVVYTRDRGIALVVAGLAGLEIVLLAGAAFAVGARRARRDLGLVGATGGDRRQLRSMVLASGVVVGVASVAIGVPLGILTGWALIPAAEHMTGTIFGHFDLRVRELAGVAIVGLVTSVLAAALPAAVASRTSVVEALTGRRGIARIRRRVPVAGVLVAATGAAVAWWGARAPVRYNVILAGGALTQLGFVLCAPTLVALAGQLAGWFPLPLRLALRDGARHRLRTAPAVAAVMTALASSVALSTYNSSDAAHQRQQYEPALGLGQAEIQFGTQPVSESVVRALASALPTRSIARFGSAAQCGSNGYCSPPVDLTDPPSDSCPPGADAATLAHDPRCRPQKDRTSHIGLAIGGPDLVQAILSHPDPAATAALARGQVVVFEASYVHGGDAYLSVPTSEASGGAAAQPRTIRLAAHMSPAPLGYLVPTAVISPVTAKRLGIKTAAASSFLFDTTRMPTQSEQQRATAIAAGVGLGVYFENGFHYNVTTGLFVLLGISALVTLAATAIATVLAGAEARADLATLAAVGAAPRTRRILSMGQAASVAGLGALLGVLAGLVPVIAVVQASSGFPLVIPWLPIAGSVIGVPLLASLIAGLFTRSRLPVQRRLA